MVYSPRTSSKNSPSFSTLLYFQDQTTLGMSAVKRKAVDPAEEPQRGHRQPQISCDSCRKRKLKCDRADPCSSCAVRGLPCHRQPSARRVGVGQRSVRYKFGTLECLELTLTTSSHSAVPSDDVLRRLQALEEAVFHGERHPGPNLYGPLVVNTPVSPAAATVTTVDDHSELGHTEKTLCETSTSDDHPDVTSYPERSGGSPGPY
jgi:hypothetical protein